MPRDSNGVYSLPAGNPVAAGTIVEEEWANTTMNDIESALNGLATLPIRFPDGSELEPSITFQNETTTGIYRHGTGDMRVTVLGQDIFRFNTVGAWVWSFAEERWIQVLGGGDGGGGGGGGGGSNDAVSAPEYFRFWWFKLHAPGIALQQVQSGVREIRLYTRGAGFINGERWDKGDQLTINPSTIAEFASIPSPIFPFSWPDLFNGTGELLRQTAANDGSSATLLFGIDFGEGDGKRITGLEFKNASDDPLQYIEVYCSNASGNTIGDFLDGTNTGTVYRWARWSDAQENNIGISELSDNQDTPHLAIIGSEQEVEVNGSPRGERTLVPDGVRVLGLADGGGGGGGGSDWWNYIFTVQTADFTAVAGNYYFVDCGSVGTIEVPAAPSPGDRVGFSILPDSLGSYYAVDFYLPNDPYVKNSATSYVLPLQYDSNTDYPRPLKLELIYLDSTWGWVPIYNELIELVGS